ncbi:MAG: ATP-binding cassette domain-containing protein [Clostridia bacterium]|nr:ATP-binding cassette domain-containing protein [Clostridia bacterium]
MILELARVNKSFAGKQILHDVSFAVNSGKIMGLVGQNGAGKTTIMRILIGVFACDSGDVLLDGIPIRRGEHRFGYLPEERGMYPRTTVIDQLVYFGELKGLTPLEARATVREWLRRLNLANSERQNLGTMSRGNQQKIHIIQAVLGDPDILVLDEPFSGLDPINTKTLKDVVHEFSEKDRIVVISSHEMGLVEEFCDAVTFIQDGRITVSAEIEAVKGRFRVENRLRLILAHESRDETRAILSQISDIDVSEDRQSIIVDLKNGKTPECLLDELLSRNLQIELFGSYQPNLEEVFISLADNP